jgi:phosphoribosylamine--glycine ligase
VSAFLLEKTMNILLLGSGGREHALAWKLAQSSLVTTVFVAPGNPGTAREAKCQNLAIAAEDIEALLAFAQEKSIDLTVVGPEAPLSKGVVDAFQAKGLKIFGPRQAAAQLEASKDFTKQFLQRHGIRTAQYQTFTDIVPALAYLQQRGAPIVIKADGLAAGKGVVVAQTLIEAEAAVIDMLSGNKLGAAGAKVVIEDFLTGEEASFIVVANGETYAPMASAQDHKRIFDGDTGPNTGGMGAYSPAPVVTTAVHDLACKDIIEPTLRGMIAEGNPFCGFLYAGLMVREDGVPFVIEFNVRMGDPETQPLLARLESDLVQWLLDTLDHQNHQPQWSAQKALGVVMAAEGYPDQPIKGDVINGLETVQGAKVFHAGTAEKDGHVVTSGGRVLCVVGLGDSIEAAQAVAYQGVSAVSWRGEQHRKDIGWRAIGRDQ